MVGIARTYKREEKTAEGRRVLHFRKGKRLWQLRAELSWTSIQQWLDPLNSGHPHIHGHKPAPSLARNTRKGITVGSKLRPGYFTGKKKNLNFSPQIFMFEME